MAFTDVLDLYYYACNDGIPKGFRKSTQTKDVDELTQFTSNSMRSTVAQAVCTDYHLPVNPHSTFKATAATFIGQLLYIYFNDGIEEANAQLASDAGANAATVAIAEEQAAIAADLAAETRVAAMVASFRASQAKEDMVASYDGPKWYDYSDDSDADSDACYNGQ